MLGVQAKPDQRDVGPLAGCHRADLRDVDLACDHLVPEPGHDLCEQLEPLAFLVGDQDTEMANRGLGHDAEMVARGLIRGVMRHRDVRDPTARRDCG